MKSTRIVNIGQVRDLLSEWEAVRQCIVAGDITGWCVTLCGPDGRETVYIGGVFAVDKASAARAALRQSAARLFVEDTPLRA